MRPVGHPALMRSFEMAFSPPEAIVSKFMLYTATKQTPQWELSVSETAIVAAKLRQPKKSNNTLGHNSLIPSGFQWKLVP